MLGASGYAFVALAGHVLDPAGAAALSSFYLVINIMGPGVFGAAEQETNRAVSAAAASGHPVAPVAQQAQRHTGTLLLTLLVGLLLATPLLVPGPLMGRTALFVMLLVGAVTGAAVHLVRGILGGVGQFSGYALTLFAEGLARLVPVGALVLAVVIQPGVYALVYVLGSALGVLAGVVAFPGTLRARRQRMRPDRTVASSVTPHRLVPLVTATLLAQAMANLAPVVLTTRLVAHPAAAASFAAAFIFARIPLFVFSPVQALLVPTLTAAVARGDLALARRLLRTLLISTGLIGLVGSGVAALVGPGLLRTLFATPVAVPAAVLGLLGVGTTFLLAALVLQAALLALGRHRTLALAWSTGTALLTLLVTLAPQPVLGAVIAQVTGSGLVTCSMLAVLVRVLRRCSRASARLPAHAGPKDSAVPQPRLDRSWEGTQP